MPPSSQFGQLPADIIVLLTEELDSPSLCNLRLASKSCKDIFTPPFLDFINESQSTELTPFGIDRLLHLSASQDLKPAVRKLELVCPYYHITPAAPSDFNTTRPGDLHPRRMNMSQKPLRLLDSPEDKSWMESQIQDQSRMNNDATGTSALLASVFRNFGKLEELALEATVVLSPEHKWKPEKTEHLHWRNMWVQTTQAFRIVTSALAQSRIQLADLHVFKETNVCSIPIDNLAIANDSGFVSVISRLKSFSISLSPALGESIELNASRSLASNHHHQDLASLGGLTALSEPNETLRKARYTDIACLVQAMSQLEVLYMHFYETFWVKVGPDPHEDMLEHIFSNSNTSLPQLKSICIQGFPMTPPALGTIALRCPHLRHLSLKCVRLEQNEWESSIEPLVHSSVKHLYISNLYFTTIVQPGHFRATCDAIVDTVASLRSQYPQHVRFIGLNEDTFQMEDLEQSMFVQADYDSLIENIPNSFASYLKFKTRRLLCGPPVTECPPPMTVHTL